MLNEPKEIIRNYIYSIEKYINYINLKDLNQADKLSLKNEILDLNINNLDKTIFDYKETSKIITERIFSLKNNLKQTYLLKEELAEK